MRLGPASRYRLWSISLIPAGKHRPPFRPLESIYETRRTEAAQFKYVCRTVHGQSANGANRPEYATTEMNDAGSGEALKLSAGGRSWVNLVRRETFVVAYARPRLVAATE